MANCFGKWFGRSPSGVYSFTFSRDMTPEEIEATSAAMDEAFAQMDDVFKAAFPDRKSRSKPAGPRR